MHPEIQMAGAEHPSNDPNWGSLRKEKTTKHDSLLYLVASLEYVPSFREELRTQYCWFERGHGRGLPTDLATGTVLSKSIRVTLIVDDIKYV
jgi:hypothetical protein